LRRQWVTGVAFPVRSAETYRSAPALIFCRPAMPVTQPLNVRFWQELPFEQPLWNGRIVPIFAIPAARQVGREPMNECRKLGMRKSTGNGDLWVNGATAISQMRRAIT